VAQDDLVDSDGEPCFEDPREAPEDKAMLALRSLVRAAAELTAEATARVLARKLAAATTSGAGLAQSQSKVFDPGGGVSVFGVTVWGVVEGWQRFVSG
jgi:hypothetical protein